MKQYRAKTEEAAVLKACEDLQVTRADLRYDIIDQKKVLFFKRVEIQCYTLQMVQEFVESYIHNILEVMGFTFEIVSYHQNNKIHVAIDTNNNSILIGKIGVILKSINHISASAISTNFAHRVDCQVDINGYLANRYKKIASLAKKLGKSVLRSKIDVKLDPMPADERKMIHKIISQMEHLRTQSYGENRNRYIVISYKK